jgi:ATP phosphoribosyltransferase
MFMNSKKDRITIAIQKSGRLAESSLIFLQSLGLKFKIRDRGLTTSCSNYPVDIIHVRDDDIPEYVSYGAADFGIVGENVLYEEKASLKVVKKLGFGICSLVIAVPKDSKIKTLKDLEGERIASSYPGLLKKFLKERGVNAAIIPIQGSVEITPSLNLADAICDITQTGSTLKEQKLVPLVTILNSQAVLTESPSSRIQKNDFLKLVSACSNKIT